MVFKIILIIIAFVMLCGMVADESRYNKRTYCIGHYCKSNFGRRIILVRDYKKVCRCRDCGKIYDKGIPYICSKCGAEIGRPTPTILQMMGSGEVTLTEKCEKVVAKKGLFGWKVREPQNPEAIQE